MKPAPLTPESIARAAAIHRKLAKLYDELGALLEPSSDPEPAEPPTEIDRARAREVLLRKGYKAAG